MKKSILEKWKRLYELASEIKKRKPWEFLASDDLIVLYLKGKSVPVLVSVLGRGGMIYGVVVYPTIASQKTLFSLVAHEKGEIVAEIVDPLSYPTARQEALSVYFGDREEIDKETYQLIKDLGLSFRGRNNWIYFESFKIGCFPVKLDIEEVDLLIECYEVILSKMSDIKKMSEEEEMNLYPTISYQPSEKNYQLTQKPYHLNDSMAEKPYQVQDELLIKRLKKQPKIIAELEMTYFYIPVEGSKNDKLPVLLLVVEKQTQIIVYANVLENDEVVFEMIRQQVVKFIEDQGRPSKIEVRVEKVAAAVENLCEQLDIVLNVVASFDCLDLIAVELLGKMIPGYEA